MSRLSINLREGIDFAGGAEEELLTLDFVAIDDGLDTAGVIFFAGLLEATDLIGKNCNPPEIFILNTN